MQKDTVKSYTDKIEITAKHETEKRNAKRFQYQIKIGKETFDFFGSQHDREIEETAKIPGLLAYSARDFSMQKSVQHAKRERAKQTREQHNDKVKADALYCIIGDFQASKCGDFFDFLEEFGYDTDTTTKLREAEIARQQIKLNADKLRRVYTHAELEALEVLFQDY